MSNGSFVAEAYNTNKISERHRHRFEFNNEYLSEFEKNGMKATGKNPDTGLVEIIEIEDHPWFVGVQFHPEYKSTVANPHPLFVSFVKAALKNKHKDMLQQEKKTDFNSVIGFALIGMILFWFLNNQAQLEESKISV